jgi:hypothetical protein
MRSPAVDRFVDALDRGRACTVDVMVELDPFAHKDVPIAEMRATFGVRPPCDPTTAVSGAR